MEPAQLRRHTQRGVYDIETARAVFDDSFIAHVSYIVDGEPACMPMIALVLDDEEVGESTLPGQSSTAVYLHGHPSTKIMELVRQASREAEDGAEKTNGSTNGHSTPSPVKVCITATKIDGLVLSSAPNGHTFNYRAATIHGTCSPVRSKAIKAKVMRGVTNKIVANRWEEVNPVSGIQPRNKEADGPDLETPPWTGVVPLWEQLGEPIESGLTPGGVVSDTLRQYIDGRNTKQEAYSKKVAK